MKTVLMVAFHYPPCHGSSGIQRTLKFSRYLPDCGWRPIILTAHPQAHQRTGDDQLQEIHQDVVVKRAFALDTARHLSLRGAYSRWMALPDRWVSWWPGAVLAGLQLVRKYRPDCIWSTYPIATALLIGLTLHRLTGTPWVVDFRDSMTEPNYPVDRWRWKSYRWIESQAIRHSACCIFTAPSTKRMYLERYPELNSDRCRVISNGYDEANFQGIIRGHIDIDQGTGQRPVRIVHAGVIYPEERDPIPFFRTIAKLKADGLISSRELQIDLRASGFENHYLNIIKDLGIHDIVHLPAPLPYLAALQDCANADALLILQAASCNHQIPAKAYEYMRLQRPILALTPKEGDTAWLLQNSGGATIVDLVDEAALYHTLPRFIHAVRTGLHPHPDSKTVQQYTRKSQTFQLAQCFSRLTDSSLET